MVSTEATRASDELVTGADLATGLGRFVTTPAEHARYSTDVSTAAAALRTGERAIAELADRGLPHRTSPTGPLFDYDDLMNVGMFSGTGQTVPELGLRYLMRFAAGSADSWFAQRHWRVQVRPRTRLGAAESEPRPAARLGVRTPRPALGVEIVGIAGDSGAVVLPDSIASEGFDAVVRLTGRRIEITDPAAVAAWRSVLTPLLDGAIVYQTVSEPMRARHQQAWAAGSADCVVAGRVLRDRLAEAGFDAVVRRGYLLGVFGSDHAWCEARVGGQVVHLDPIFAFVATRGSTARGIAPMPEFAEACRGSRFNRLLPCAGDDGAALVTLDGAPAPYWSLSGVSARPWHPA